MPPATAFPVFGQPIGHAALQLAPFGHDACYGCATVQGRRGRYLYFGFYACAIAKPVPKAIFCVRTPANVGVQGKS